MSDNGRHPLVKQFCFYARVFLKFFGKVFLTREEVYNENSGETQPIQVFVKPDYYNSEFDLNGKNKGNDKTA